MTEQQFEQDLSRGPLKPIYFLYGEEPYLVDRAHRRLLEVAVDQDTKDFNLSVYYGAEANMIQVVDAASTLPMFADRRVVLVRGVDKLPADQHERLIEYLQNPAPDTCLIMTAAKPDMRRKLYAELKKQAGSIEFKKLFDNKLLPFVIAEVRAVGKKIDTAAAEMLVFLIGNQLQTLVTQVQKLCLVAGNRPSITIEDVRSSITSVKDFTAFELAAAIGHRSLDQAIRSLDALLMNPNDAYTVIGSLAGHIRRLWHTREMIDNGLSQEEITAALKIPPFFIKDSLVQARNYTTQELIACMLRLYAADRDIKSGRGGGIGSVLYQVVLETIRPSR